MLLFVLYGVNSVGSHGPYFHDLFATAFAVTFILFAFYVRMMRRYHSPTTGSSANVSLAPNAMWRQSVPAAAVAEDVNSEAMDPQLEAEGPFHEAEDAYPESEDPYAESEDPHSEADDLDPEAEDPQPDVDTGIDGAKGSLLTRLLSFPSNAVDLKKAAIRTEVTKLCDILDANQKYVQKTQRSAMLDQVKGFIRKNLDLRNPSWRELEAKRARCKQLREDLPKILSNADDTIQNIIGKYLDTTEDSSIPTVSEHINNMWHEVEAFAMGMIGRPAPKPDQPRLGNGKSLTKLPEELVLLISEELPEESRVALASTCTTFRVWMPHARYRNLARYNKLEYQRLVERENPCNIVCLDCSDIHKPSEPQCSFDPATSQQAPANATIWRAPTTPAQQKVYVTICSEHGTRFDYKEMQRLIRQGRPILSLVKTSHRLTMSPVNSCEISAKCKFGTRVNAGFALLVINNSAVVVSRYLVPDVIKPPNRKERISSRNVLNDFSISAFAQMRDLEVSLCPHCKMNDSDIVEQLSCHREHQYGIPCVECRYPAQCKECDTEIDASFVETTKNRNCLNVTTWRNLGSIFGPQSEIFEKQGGADVDRWASIKLQRSARLRSSVKALVSGEEVVLFERAEQMEMKRIGDGLVSEPWIEPYGRLD